MDYIKFKMQTNWTEMFKYWLSRTVPLGVNAVVAVFAVTYVKDVGTVMLDNWDYYRE
jgi:hypothetical protein